MPTTSMSATTTGVLTTMRVTTTQIQWTGSGAIGDTIEVQDNQGRTIFRVVTGVAQYAFSLTFPSPTDINGINVVTLASGKVTVSYV